MLLGAGWRSTVAFYGLVEFGADIVPLGVPVSVLTIDICAAPVPLTPHTECGVKRWLRAMSDLRVGNPPTWHASLCSPATMSIAYNSGMARSMNSSKSGTVNARSPWAGL